MLSTHPIMNVFILLNPIMNVDKNKFQFLSVASSLAEVKFTMKLKGKGYIRFAQIV